MNPKPTMPPNVLIWEGGKPGWFDWFLAASGVVAVVVFYALLIWLIVATWRGLPG